MTARAVLELDDVFVVYPPVAAAHRTGFEPGAGGVAALRGLSLALYEGERLVVTGPSGSGKSTLVNVVTAAASPSAGTIRLGLLSEGSTIRELVASGRVGVVTQGSGRELLPELSCLENVALTSRLHGIGRTSAQTLAWESLARFGVSHVADRRPMTLSTGEAQRVALAATLRPDALFVVADEPAGALDRAAASEIYALLDSFVTETGAALLVVSHDRLADGIADRVATIRDGRVERLQLRSDEPATSAAASSVIAPAHVGAPLVVDGRGWVRLPESQRTGRSFNRALASTVDGGVLLRAIDDSGAGAVEAEVGESGAVSIGVVPPMPAVPPMPIVAPVKESKPSTSTPGPKFVPGEIVGAVKDVRVRIHSVDILGPVSLDLVAGQIVAIAGPSGAGKTTLLSVVAGLRVPTAGTVSWVEARPPMAFAPSTPGFAEDATVRFNLQSATEDEIERLLASLGVEHLVNRPLRTLSGGERQRVGLARALLSSGPGMLVVLDEPTSQLDERNSVLVAKALQVSAAAGSLVLVATHDDHLLAVADQIVPLG